MCVCEWQGGPDSSLCTSKSAPVTINNFVVNDTIFVNFNNVRLLMAGGSGLAAIFYGNQHCVALTKFC